ncbi:MAG: GNAT family N-acetyltransferase [Blastomonas sp.]
MFARTERLLLRPIWPEDWRNLLAGIADERIICNLASAPWPYGEADARDFAAREQHARLPHFLLTRPGEQGQELIGCCGIDDQDGAVELGYWIARAHWGQGYATEAGRAVVGLARMLGHRRLAASHYVDNPASGRVLGKIGFRPTGKVRDRYSKARGRKVAAVQFALDLDGPDLGDQDGVMMRSAPDMNRRLAA